MVIHYAKCLARAAPRTKQRPNECVSGRVSRVCRVCVPPAAT